jgi:hypothetical protein
MKRWVEYSVPVLALVDCETRTVERVVIDDESTSAPQSLYDGDHQRLDFSPGDLAIRIAESVEWPAWSVGF